MKFILIYLYGLMVFSYTLGQQKKPVLTQKNYKTTESANVYKIIKIDTIENINVIFAKKNESTYKIVLFQDSLDCTISIKTGQSYNLSLKSVFLKNYGPPRRISAVRYGSIAVSLERDNGVIWDLFYIVNIKDLCEAPLSCRRDKKLPFPFSP